MAKKSKINLTSEEREKMLLDRDLKDIKERIAWNITPKNPTRQFIVGERVQWGAHKETYIVEIGEDKLYYKIPLVDNYLLRCSRSGICNFYSGSQDRSGDTKLCSRKITIESDNRYN